MKPAWLLFLAPLAASCSTPSPVFPIPPSSAQTAFGGIDGTLVLLDCSTGEACQLRPEAASVSLPPCSTFKIWNILIGFESGLLSSPGQPFYSWDGTKRDPPDWNRNLTLEEAFRVSCVPAFQALARDIGLQRMRSWIERIGYGDRDLSSGVDVFWLPAAGRKTILITPEEQARLLCRLVTGQLPFSAESRNALRAVMCIRETSRGTLFGKTGSGMHAGGICTLGWFVGYVECGGKTYAFACAIRGDRLTGKDARAIVETLLMQNGFL